MKMLELYPTCMQQYRDIIDKYNSFNCSIKKNNIISRIITIDSKETIVYDNGFSLEKYDENNYKLHVYIANSPSLYGDDSKLWNKLHDDIMNKRMSIIVPCGSVGMKMSLKQNFQRDIIHLEFFLDCKENTIFDKISRDNVIISKNYSSQEIEKIYYGNQANEDIELIHDYYMIPINARLGLDELVSNSVNNAIKNLGKN